MTAQPLPRCGACSQQLPIQCCSRAVFQSLKPWLQEVLGSIYHPPPEQPWEVGESSIRQGQQLPGEEARTAHYKTPTADATSSPFRPHSLRSCAQQLPELRWLHCVRGKLTAPHSHSTRSPTRKGSLITSQSLGNHCSSSSLPGLFPPQGLSTDKPLSEGDPATSLQWFYKQESLQWQL